MAYTLNTGHALYANIIECIGVEAGAGVSLVTPRTFTKHAEASYGTGTYGEHFSTVYGGFTVKGFAFDDLSFSTYTNTNITIVYVLNSIGDFSGKGPMVCSGQANTPNIGLSGTSAATLHSYSSLSRTGTVDVSAGAHMLAVTRTGETSHELFVDAVSDATGTRLAYNTSAALYNYIGGVSGQASCAIDLVWAIWFDKVLTPTEISDLYASLGANNAISIVDTGATDTTAPILSTPTGSATGDTTASGSVSTDEDNGTLFGVVTTSATAPSVAQVQAGQDHTGAAAAFAVGSGAGQAVSATGVQNVSATGLTPSTAYYWHYQQQDTAANDSTVVTSAQFTTDAAADTTPDAYSFTDQTDVSLSTLTTSNTITVTGIDSSTPISITGGEYSINGGAYTSASGNVVVNDTVTLRVTSSASYSTAVNVDLDIGGVLDTWTVTTVPVISDVLHNNTESIHASQAVVWSWLPAGRIGTLSGVTPQDGTGTTAADGKLTISTPLTPPAILMVAVQNTDATDDDVYYEAFG